ncbi:MAG: hypothetical protein ACW986_02865 [Promethearchaeota archaeon]|jgi:hypothetical protein
MKKSSKILLGTFAMALLFTVASTSSVVAAGETPVEVNGDTIQTQIQANNQVMFSFRQRTRLRFNSTVDIDLNIQCDALRIGIKNFAIEIDCDQNMEMNMTCTEEQTQLGLLKGNIYQIRNRNREHLYQEGFCVSIECNSSQIQAKLKIEATNQNRLSTWAYYDETSEEWVPTPSHVEEGYLVTETDHFSFWTVLIPESDNSLMLYVGLISVVGIVAVLSVVILRRRK